MKESLPVRNSDTILEVVTAPRHPVGAQACLRDYDAVSVRGIGLKKGSNLAIPQEQLGEDVKKFSHALRDFRNYIHPYQQVSSRFTPDEHTAKMCWQVLQAAITQLSR